MLFMYLVHPDLTFFVKFLLSLLHMLFMIKNQCRPFFLQLSQTLSIIRYDIEVDLIQFVAKQVDLTYEH